MSLTNGFHLIDHCMTCPVRHDRQFCKLPMPALETMDSVKATAAYPKGALLCLEGQPAQGVYVLCTGRAKVMTGSADGRTMILRVAEPGELLGISAVVSGGNYEATVETLEASQAAFISRNDFLKFIQKHPEVGMNVAGQLTTNCQSAYEEIRSLGLGRSVPARMAALILRWAQKPMPGKNCGPGEVQIRVTLTQEEIAQMIGSSRETVSRVISDFKKRGVLRVKGATWTLDRARMQAESTAEKHHA